MKSLYISRFRLFHKGYLDVVKYILGKDERELIIGIGASQHSHHLDNHFTGKEAASVGFPRFEVVTACL